MSSKTTVHRIPTLAQFCDIPLSKMRVLVDHFTLKKIGNTTYETSLFIHFPEINISNQYTIPKTYLDFLDLYKDFKSFLKKYKKKEEDLSKIKLQDFPPLIQIGNKEEKRLTYFNTFLNTIFNLAQMYENPKQDTNIDVIKRKKNMFKLILMFIYSFIFEKNTKDLTSSEISNQHLQEIFGKSLNEVENSNISEQEKKNFENLDFKEVESGDIIGENATKELQRVLTESVSSLSDFERGDSQNLSLLSKKKMSMESSNEETKKRKESDNVSLQKNTGIHPQNLYAWRNILIRTSLEGYKIGKMKIVEKCLLLYNETDENFYILIPLVKINVDIILLKNNCTTNALDYFHGNARFITDKEIYDLDEYDPQTLLSIFDSEIIVKLSHDYSNFETSIKFEQNTSISTVKSFVYALRQCSYSESAKSLCINEISESFVYNYGVLLIDILKVKTPNYKGSINVKISLGPYTFSTKTEKGEGEYNYNQKFIIPIHNRFQEIKFLLYKIKTFKLSKNTTEVLIGEYSIILTELISTFFLSQNTIHLKFKPTKEENNNKYADMTLEYKAKNWSSLMSLLVKNKNKNIIDDYPLYNSSGDQEEPYKIGTLMKRVKRVIKYINNIVDTYDLLINFKYPVLSGFTLISLISYLLICDPRYILNHIIIVIFLFIFCYSSFYKKYLQSKVNKFFFKIRNPYDTPSTIVGTVSSKSDEEITQSDYLVKKEQFVLPSIKKIKEYKQNFVDVLYNVTDLVSFFEKFKNIFIWTDPLLSYYICALLIVGLLLVWNIQLRYLMVFSYTKKFIKGMFYYKKKLINNKEIGRIILTHVFEIWKKDNTDIKNKTMNKVVINNDRLKMLINSKLLEHASIVIDDAKFFEVVENFDDAVNEIGKAESMLKINKTSELYYYTKENYKIFKKSLEPEDVLAHFIENVKSDYFRASHGFIKNESYDYNDDEELENLMNK